MTTVPPKEIKIYYHSPDHFAKENKKSNRSYLFTYNDIKDNFQAILKEWYFIKSKLEPITSLLYSSFSDMPAFGENKFLNMMHALETFHRRFKNNKLFSDEVFSKKTDEIINAVPKKYKEYLKERLYFGNEPTLQQRLEELINGVFVKTIENIIPDKTQFIRDAKNSRNYYTHYDERLAKKALDIHDLYYLCQKLRIILIANILIEINFTTGEIDKMLQKIEWLRFNHLINKPPNR